MDQELAPFAPFQAGWYSFDLGQYRPCDSTYCFYSYQSLPPVLDADEALGWLGPLDGDTDRRMDAHRNDPEARGNLAAISASAQRLGLTLPASFLRLMGSPDLQDRIPSCTACYFSLGDDIVACPGSDGGYIVRFLNDQQDVLLWYLYLTPRGEHCVLVSPIPLDEVASDNADGNLTDADRQAVLQSTYICAPSFAAFVYRFGLENVLWFKLNEGNGQQRLTDEERRYLAHYGMV